MPDLRICLDVDDVARAIAFCSGALGLEVGRLFGPGFCLPEFRGRGYDEVLDPPAAQ